MKSCKIEDYDDCSCMTHDELQGKVMVGKGHQIILCGAAK